MVGMIGTKTSQEVDPANFVGVGRKDVEEEVVEDEAVDASNGEKWRATDGRDNGLLNDDCGSADNFDDVTPDKAEFVCRYCRCEFGGSDRGNGLINNSACHSIGSFCSSSTYHGRRIVDDKHLTDDHVCAADRTCQNLG